MTNLKESEVVCPLDKHPLWGWAVIIVHYFSREITYYKKIYVVMLILGLIFAGYTKTQLLNNLADY